MIWSPSTEQAIVDAAANGLLTETHYLDLKRELPPGNAGNKEIAKDIAAFALDGGTILIGVDEDTSPPSITPVDLDGLPERVEQVGAMRVQEGVSVSTVPIETPPGSGRGVLVIRVPASPRAPHMADDKYYGRGDKANRVLSHAEVLRLHQQQVAHHEDAVEAARRELDRFLGTSPAVKPPLMVALAIPLGPPPGMLKPLSAAVGEWQTTVHEMLKAAGVERQQKAFDPNFGNTTPVRRAGAVAVRTYAKQGRGFEDKRAAEMQLRESGVILLGSRRPVMEAVHEGGEEWVFDELIVGHTELLVRLSGVLSDRFGFAGSWRFGLLVTGLQDKESYAAKLRMRHSEPYSEDRYEASAAASLVEISSAPERVVEDLVGPLLRSLNSRALFPELDE